MVLLISEFFNTLLGCNIPDSVCTIMGFGLVSILFQLFFGILGIKDNKVWKTAIYISMGILAILAICDVANFSVTFGGL